MVACSRVHQPRPIRSTGSHVDVDDVVGGEEGDSSSSALEEGYWPTRSGGGWEGGGNGVGGGGGAGQPLLLSLADLTTAGLQKLLQAEGGSKMFFDPDAQRWVGEEVDLSGFEESLPGGGRGSSIGSAAMALSPRFSTSTSPKVVGSASPRLARDVGGRRLPTSAHRRWSSLGGVQVAEWERWGQLAGGRGAAGLDAARAEERSHRRRRSASGLGQTLRGRGGGAGGGAGGSGCGGGGGGGSGGGTGRGEVLASGVPARGAKRGGSGKGRSSPVSRGSSAASSNLRSDSDTGSVIRLWEDNRQDEGGQQQEQQQPQQGPRSFDRDNSNDVGDQDSCGRPPGAPVLRRAGSLGRPRRSSYGSCGSGGSAAGSGNGGASPRRGGRSPLGAGKTASSGGGSGERLSVGIGGEHRLTRSRLAQVFEGTALASPDCRVEEGSLDTPGELKARVQKDRALLQGWPSAPLSTSSSPPLGRESGQASESEMGASEMSDWDQVRWCFFIQRRKKITSGLR